MLRQSEDRARRARLPYNKHMAKKGASLEITCPCCQAKLRVDAELGVVLSHTEAVRPPRVDLDKVDEMLREQTRAREEKFQQSMEFERNKEEILNRKFAEALEKNKDLPAEKPLRDFDLD
jgi:hypothetical protein